MRKDKKWQRRACEWEPDMEIEDQVANVEMPGLSSVNIWASIISAEDIVTNNIEGNPSELFVKPRID